MRNGVPDNTAYWPAMLYEMHSPGPRRTLPCSRPWVSLGPLAAQGHTPLGPWGALGAQL